MSTDIKVGDKVRLTGEGWDGRMGFPDKGTIVTIARIDERGIPRMAPNGKRPEDLDFGIYNAGIAGYGKDSPMVRDWSGELVVEEAPKFQVGDVVRHFSSTRTYEVIEVRKADGWLRFKRFETTGYFKPGNYSLVRGAKSERPTFKPGDRVQRNRSTNWGDADDLVGGQAYTVRAVLRGGRIITLNDANDDTFTYNAQEFTLLPELKPEVGARVRITVEADIRSIGTNYSSYGAGSIRLYSDQLANAGAKVEVIAAPAPEPPKPTTAEQMLALKPGQAFKVSGLEYTYVRQEDDSYIAFDYSGKLEQPTKRIADTKWDRSHAKVTVVA